MIIKPCLAGKNTEGQCESMSLTTMKPLGSALFVLAVTNLISESSCTSATPADYSSLPTISTGVTFPTSAQTSAITVTEAQTFPPITVTEAQTSSSNMLAEAQTSSTMTPTGLENQTNTDSMFEASSNGSTGSSTAQEPPANSSTHASNKTEATMHPINVQEHVPSTTETMSPKASDSKMENKNTKPTDAPSFSSIWTAVCIALGVIVSIVILAFLCKMCQRKTPAVQHTGTKTSAQNKESVKLLSVKTSTPDSDVKRIAPPLQLEFNDES
ncbi:endomucin isoform X2 [Ascaphus truei]|uniref:endomucin isoform X2 n=1 Tax=Ascaphus truei TaxID=8439 RepID=UPI003F5A8CFD